MRTHCQSAILEREGETQMLPEMRNLPSLLLDRWIFAQDGDTGW